MTTGTIRKKTAKKLRINPELLPGSAKYATIDECEYVLIKEIDPIEELHQIRQKIYKEAGGTPESLVRHYINLQKQYADRLVERC